jgi:hypothetical protein
MSNSFMTFGTENDKRRNATMSRLSEEEIAGMRNQIKAGRTVWTHILMERLLADREAMKAELDGVRKLWEADIGEMVRRLKRINQLEAELATAQAELAEAITALRIVSAGIWREDDCDACGIACGSFAAQTVEKFLANKSASEGEG